MYNVRLEAPWYTFQKKVKALFDGDPDFIVGDIYDIVDNEATDGSEPEQPTQYAFDIEVRNHEKAIALERVMPTIKSFGNVLVKIYIYDEENQNTNGTELYETIFKDNPHIKDFKNVPDFTGTVHSFVRFKPEVIQFFNDDISDYNGNCSILAQDIAKEVFMNANGVHFCTASADENAMPLKDWN